jgi:hypothetical protein
MWKIIAVVAISIVLIIIAYDYLKNNDEETIKIPQQSYAYINNYNEQYPAYYVTQYDKLNADAERCLSIPKVKESCVNKKLMETGGDMAQSIRECRINGQVVEGCKKNKCKNEYYPYIPQYVTLKKHVHDNHEIRTGLNVPKEKLTLVPDDYDQNFFNGAQNVVNRSLYKS